ncbi:hypothetical protein [Nocardia sp. N2S4-5]|uniref:hypothetical protein n=1 Tax=Nocardia sp. N2S4-5 TaxID=3351565 RepID=UPI0037D53CDB
MALRRYLVKVHCCGSRWLIEVPALARWTPVDEKNAIADTAKVMITAVTGTVADSFGVDLIEDRVITSLPEYTATATTLQRWNGPPVVGPSDAA